MTPRRDRPREQRAVEIGVVGEVGVRRFRRSLTIGRSPKNDLVIDDRYVSGCHAEIRRAPDGWELRDAGSTNGTFVDGERVDRVRLEGITHVHLGHPTGPEVVLRVPREREAARDAESGGAAGMLDRYLGDEEPADMSARTRALRLALSERREHERHRFRRHTLWLRAAVAVLLLVAVSATGLAVLANRRSNAQRMAAAEVFHTIKALELDLRRLQETAGADPAVLARHEELQRRYDRLLETLGIYGEGTDERVKLVYRVVHKFGESEVNVPREFVQEVLDYVDRWKGSDLAAIVRRAARNDYGRRITQTLSDHYLPPEFFYLALQESGFDTDAVGPETRFGFAKGMWQFIPQTAERYGLQPGPLLGEPRPDPLDERHDFEKATTAAARYLYDIYTTDAQASGLLVMASYNWGEQNLIPLIRSLPADPSARNYWNLLEHHRDRIPDETYDYVLRIVSAAVIGENPRLFGFDFDPPLEADVGLARS